MTKKRTLTVFLALALLLPLSIQLASAFDLDPGGGVPTTTVYANTLSGERSENVEIKLGGDNVANTYFGYKITELTLNYFTAADGYHFTSFKLKFSASWGVWLTGLELDVFLKYGDNAYYDCWGHTYDLQIGELDNGETTTVSKLIPETSGTWTKPYFIIRLKVNNGFDQKWLYLETKFKIENATGKWSVYSDTFTVEDWGRLAEHYVKVLKWFFKIISVIC